MGRGSKKALISGIIALAASGGLSFLARNAGGFAQWYSVTIYPLLVGTLGRFSGLLGFSLVEVLLYIVVAAVSGLLIRLVVRIGRKKAGKKDVAGFVSGIFCFGACLLLVYTLNCGINYHRTSFEESIGLKAQDYTVGQLAQVCIVLTEELNNLAPSVARGEDGAMILTGSTEAESVEVMKHIAADFSPLQGYYPEPKGLIIPQILSVQSITGVYSPFTIEANYNDDITAYNIPFTACHELSHLRGFMREEEANFIAWLACRASDNTEFQYSGSLRGWISCMNALYRANYEVWAAIRVQLNPLVEYDLAANRAYWDKYEGKIAQTAEKINDGYLKANGQTDGIKSYGRMADLIVAWLAEE